MFIGLVIYGIIAALVYGMLSAHILKNASLFKRVKDNKLKGAVEVFTLGISASILSILWPILVVVILLYMNKEEQVV